MLGPAAVLAVGACSMQDRGAADKPGAIIAAEQALGTPAPLLEVAWDAPGVQPAQRRNLHTATLLSDGRVLVVGGSPGGTAGLDTADVYDPRIGGWTAAGTSGAARWGHTSTVLSNGTVLVAGGTSNTSNAFVFYLYPPDGSTATKQGNMASSRFGHTATLLDADVVLLAGGNWGPELVPTVEYFGYRPKGNWADAMPGGGRWHHAAVRQGDGRVLICGGLDGAGATLSSCDRYDPRTLTWDLNVPSLAIARAHFTMTRLPDGSIYAFGGEGPTAGAFATPPERFDGNAWTTLLPAGMTSPDGYPGRSEAAIVAVNERFVAISGGYRGTPGAVSVLDDVELFDLRAGEVAGRIPGLGPRARHTATRLRPAADGSVALLFVGAELGADLQPLPGSTSMAKVLRFIAPGATCTASAECSSGACAQGVCALVGCAACEVDSYPARCVLGLEGTPCVAEPGDCVARSTCDAYATCALAYLASGTECRPSTGPCDPAEQCEGGALCPPDISLVPGCDAGVCGATGCADAGSADAASVDAGGPDGGCEDAAGLDAAGLDAAGLDAAGLDAAGLDAAGLDAAGLDAAGLDAAGLDAAGLDAAGLDAAGLDAAGLDAAGHNAGLDAAGLDAAGLDAGLDAAGTTDATVSQDGWDATPASFDASAEGPRLNVDLGGCGCASGGGVPDVLLGATLWILGAARRRGGG